MSATGEIAGLFAVGRAAWPELALDEVAFEHHVRARGGDVPPLDLAADAYLACACTLGVAGAVEALERAHGKALARALARVDPRDAFVADALQTFREHVLLPSDGAPPRIAAYRARAPLGAWLRAAAVRTALNLRRRKDAAPHDSIGGLAARAAPGNIESVLIRAEYKELFEDAVRRALVVLPDDARTLLRLHLVEGMSIDRLAVVYRVGRSTAARRLAAAKQALADAARRAVMAGAKLTETEFASVAAALQDDLDVSIARHLAG